MAENVEIKVELDVEEAKRELEDFKKESDAAEKSVSRVSNSKGGSSLKGGAGGKSKGLARIAGSIGRVVAIVGIILVIARLILDNVNNLAKLIDQAGLTNFAKNFQEFGNNLNEVIDRITTQVEAIQGTADIARTFAGRGVAVNDLNAIRSELTDQAVRRSTRERAVNEQQTADYSKLILQLLGRGPK